MGLFSIFQRKPRGTVKTPPEPSADSVQEARTRARRRLIGAVVLVVIGVIGFPLLFETQPRPIPVDIPIEIPRKESAPALTMPAARPAKPVASVPVEPPPAASAEESSKPASTPADAGRVAPPQEKPASEPAKASEPAEAKPAAVSTPPAEAPASSTAVPKDGKRARALLEGKAVDKDGRNQDGGRFVVQVGAFSDKAAARETRMKVEKLGLKTYTQVAETSSGSRIRVRVGPFASREDAERVQAKIKAAGSQAVVLTL